MTETEQGGTKGRKFSMTRLMITIIIVILIAIVAFNIGKQAPPPDASKTKRILGMSEPRPRQMSEGLTDADGDLIADAPVDDADLVDPEALLFSFVGQSDAEGAEAAWQPMVDHLKNITGKPVQYVRFSSSADQLKALKEGRLHVTAVNTGNVPEAVASCGFVPVATPAKNNKAHGYTMVVIVPVDSPIHSPQDLAGKQIAFTTAGSNSGYKAPIDALMREYNLMPDADYRFVFSMGHVESIKGIADGKYQAAAVASDMLDLAIANGEASSSDFKTVYTSEVFPSLALGYAYNLKPELAEKVRTALLDFNPKDSTAASQLADGVTGFAPVTYKNDWALVRRIDESFAGSSKKNDG